MPLIDSFTTKTNIWVVNFHKGRMKVCDTTLKLQFVNDTHKREVYENHHTLKPTPFYNCQLWPVLFCEADGTIVSYLLY